MDKLDKNVSDTLKVLLVDDDRHMRKIIRSVLHSLGITNVCEANDAESGLKETGPSQPDLIIVGWLSEPTYGPDFVRLIRAEEHGANAYIPIIILSSHTELRHVIEARDAGANEFLVKPVSPKTLNQRLISIIDNPRPFIRTKSYFGPCRRRQDNGPPPGVNDRRMADPMPDRSAGIGYAEDTGNPT